MSRVLKVVVTEESPITKSIDIRIEGWHVASVRVIKPEARCGRKGSVTIQASTCGPRSLETVAKFAVAVRHAMKLARAEETKFSKTSRIKGVDE